MVTHQDDLSDEEDEEQQDEEQFTESCKNFLAVEADRRLTDIQEVPFQRRFNADSRHSNVDSRPSSAD